MLTLFNKSTVAGMTLAILLLAPATDTMASPQLKCGVALHGPLTWGRTNSDRTAYAWPIYEGQIRPAGYPAASGQVGRIRLHTADRRSGTAPWHSRGHGGRNSTAH